MDSQEEREDYKTHCRRAMHSAVDELFTFGTEDDKSNFILDVMAKFDENVKKDPQPVREEFTSR